MSENNLRRRLRKISLALVLMTVIFLTNVISGGQALAADSYDAPIDGYVESRNPNRVDSTTEELAKSKINLPDENKGESIYQRVVERTNEQKTNSALGKTKTESSR